MQQKSLPALDSVQRRCAAFMTLSEVLVGESLMNALWMLEERDQSADKLTYIGFFGVTAELLGVNSNVITTLYAKLNRTLDLSIDELPQDPMPEMLKFRGIETESQKINIEKKSGTEETVKKPVAKTKGTPEMTVCVSIITHVMSEAGFPQAEAYALFNEVFKEEIDQEKLDDDIKQQLLSWVDILSIKAFKRNYAEDQLSKIVHCVYIALCEALGPVKADSIMTLAVNKTSKLPAAKLYSPKNFL